MQLYLMYARHGGNKDEDDGKRKGPLKKPEQMRKQLAEFKHQMKKIAKNAVSEGDEWHLQTDNAKKPSLRALVVDGRAPAIKGMPVVEEEDAKAIVMAILAMRGADKKKHKEALEEGMLKLPIKKLPMQGVVQTWRQACGKSEE